MSSVEHLERRVSALEQLVIVVVSGGGTLPHLPHRGDPFASDTTRIEALYRRGGPIVDPAILDITRLSLQELETQANEVSAAITRLQAHQGELHARLKELRGKSA